MAIVTGSLSLSLFASPPALQSTQENTFLRDDFTDLANWKPHYFSNIEEHSTYTVEKVDQGSYLKAKSDKSASALLLKEKFSVYEYPFIRWRWKIDTVYDKGNARTKGGDDYPIRLYVIFRKKRFFGLISVPHSSLNYIWANRVYEEKIIPNAYTAKSVMILLQEGESKAGLWITEEINIIEDYRRAFGMDPPVIATIGIMNDSDNTRESSTSYIDFIEIFRK